MHIQLLLAVFRFAPLVLLASLASAEESSPLLMTEDFEQPLQQWRILDPENWRVVDDEGNRVLSLHSKTNSYKPPHRSPHHVALLKDPIVGDFELKVRVRSTTPDYPHRDACLFFGYQNAEHFYYVHIGKRTDPHCNQIFIVNGADRKKISTKTTKGTDWDDAWHTVRIVRKVETGDIAIYWDNEKEPIMTAQDKTFAWGRVGVGSFDDTADWDDLQLRGEIPEAPLDHGDFKSPNPYDKFRREPAEPLEQSESEIIYPDGVLIEE